LRANVAPPCPANRTGALDVTKQGHGCRKRLPQCVSWARRGSQNENKTQVTAHQQNFTHVQSWHNSARSLDDTCTRQAKKSVTTRPSRHTPGMGIQRCGDTGGSRLLAPMGEIRPASTRARRENGATRRYRSSRGGCDSRARHGAWGTYRVVTLLERLNQLVRLFRPLQFLLLSLDVGEFLLCLLQSCLLICQPLLR
jgi:hypothetical protein